MRSLICMIFLIFSCGKSEESISSTVEKPLSLSTNELKFLHTEETKTVQITAGTDDISVEVNDSGKDWCQASLKAKTLQVAVKKNDTFMARQTSLTVTAGTETSVVSISQETVDFQSVTKRVPIGGNSYITTKGTSGSVEESGFLNWIDKTVVFSTFFRLNIPGDLKLYLEYSADSHNNTIDVSCEGRTFTTVLPKPVKQSDTIIYVGTVNILQAGYTKVDFKGKEKTGYRYAIPSALYIYGSAMASVNLVDDFSFYWGRRGPSVHMAYTMPAGKKAEYFYNEVTVPEGDDALGSYFMSNGFGQGYFGIQVNSASERRVLFSVWSPYETDDPASIPEEYRVKLVKKGEGVTTGEFGNEGSGGQSYFKYSWKAGTTYKFLTRIRPSTDGYSEYTSYFFAPEAGKWKLIAQFLRPKTTTWYTGAHSFLENFNPATGYMSRKARYGNQWIYTDEKEWIELTKGRFTVDDTGRSGARKDHKGGVENGSFFLQNCGFFNDYTLPDMSFERTPVGVSPQINWDELE